MSKIDKKLTNFCNNILELNIEEDKIESININELDDFYCIRKIGDRLFLLSKIKIDISIIEKIVNSIYKYLNDNQPENIKKLTFIDHAFFYKKELISFIKKDNENYFSVNSNDLTSIQTLVNEVSDKTFNRIRKLFFEKYTNCSCENYDCNICISKKESFKSFVDLKFSNHVRIYNKIN